MPLQDGPAAADGCRFVPDFSAVAQFPLKFATAGYSSYRSGKVCIDAKRQKDRQIPSMTVRNQRYQLCFL